MATKGLEQGQFLRYVRTVGMTTMRGRGFYYPIDSAMSNDGGRLYVLSRSFERAVSDSMRVTMLNEDGEYFGVFGSAGIGDGQFRWPCGIAVNDQNRVFVTDEYLNRVSVFNESGEFLKHWGSEGEMEGMLNGPSGIVFDRDNNVLIADSRNHRIQKFTSDGEFVKSFGEYGSGDGCLNLPWGLGVNQEGEIFVADWGNDRIQRFTPVSYTHLTLPTSDLV